MPNQEKGFGERGFLYKLDYYFQIFFALCIFAFVADKILNGFMPGYAAQFVHEWSQFGHVFTYSYEAMKKFLLFVFRLPDIIMRPLLK